MWLLLTLLSCATQDQWPEERPAKACDALGLPQLENRLSVETPSRTRYGVVYAPPGPGPHDVIVNLHEFRSEPRRQQHYTGWIHLAKEANAILIGPDAKSSTWNAGRCCGKSASRKVDDVTFLDLVVDRIDATGCTSGRVLATGIGNGAMMAHRWACESDKVDGVISVGGGLQVETCDNPKPIPMLAYHGMDDTYYPAEGLKTLNSEGHSLAQWRTRNKAPDAGQLAVDGDLSCTTWSGESPVVYCEVAGMEDQWPGAHLAKVNSESPLRDATRGGWAWMEQQWAAKK